MNNSRFKKRVEIGYAFFLYQEFHSLNPYFAIIGLIYADIDDIQVKNIYKKVISQSN